MDGLPDGIYEQLIDSKLMKLLLTLDGDRRTSELRKLEKSDSSEVLTQHMGAELRRLLPSIKAPVDRLVEAQVKICNDILSSLAESTKSGVDTSSLSSPANQLLSINRKGEKQRRPITPISVSELLTGAKGEPRLGNELFAELASSDSVDILVSFIKWHGLRRILEPLRNLAQNGKRVRVLTTTYMGATDLNALVELARLPNTEVRISFDDRRTRLHAKAWLFKRNSGFHTAYVGSANLSASALETGLEWTLKACQADMPHVIERFTGAFESLWEDSEFEPFDPESTTERKRVADALEGATGGKTLVDSFAFTLKLDPYPFQADILDDIRAERELRGHWKNLVVSATGTGKTMISAFDYRRQIGTDGIRPRLLFVAHREELLSQALNSFRHVLRDGSFGEILTGKHKPTEFNHLFTTIQSFNSRQLLDIHGEDYWDYIVVDEFHHAAAKSYRYLLDSTKPRILLGLTATPERTDGLDILHWFDNRVAAEVRLWDALDRQLLTPFEYHGIHDNTDLTSLRWQRGGYEIEELSNIYTGNDIRTSLVVEQFCKLYGDPLKSRVLGFCVNVDHAKYMATKFCQAGIPSIAVHGNTNTTDRASAIGRLRERKINAIFTCDLYNEGVDIPEADCLLLLRPTESPTIFLQQLGRGLRLSEGKPVTLVLDFIGQMHSKYRFDLKLGALTGLKRGELEKAVAEGFPLLPSGCHVQLDKVAQGVVLDNLKEAIRPRLAVLVGELQSMARASNSIISIAEFLHAQSLSLDDLYEKRIGGWGVLCRTARLAPQEVSETVLKIGTRFGRILHIDDEYRLMCILNMLDGAKPVTLSEQRVLLMLGYRLADTKQRADVTVSWARDIILSDKVLSDELRQICKIKLDHLRTAPENKSLPADWPLSLHRRYQRDEILAAVGEWTPDKQSPWREGTKYLKEDNIDLFLITLDKSSKKFEPYTRYNDYSISEQLFYWQCPSTIADHTPTGQRYINGHKTGTKHLLFVRENENEPYCLIGPAVPVKHEGNNPISFTMKLETPMPSGLHKRFATLKSG